jgi:hypothetical protein
MTVAIAAVGLGDRGASLDATEIGLCAALETTQSGSAVETREMRRSTCETARRCAR